MSDCSNGNNNIADGNGARSTQSDLQLRLAPPKDRAEADNGNTSDSSSARSCLSSDDSCVLVLGGCTQCQKYYMVTKKDFPTCFVCKQPSLIGFHDEAKRTESK